MKNNKKELLKALRVLKEAIDATKFVSDQEIKEYWGFLSKQDRVRAKKEAARKGMELKQFISQLVYAEKMRERGFSEEDGDYDSDLSSFAKDDVNPAGMRYSTDDKSPSYASKKNK